MYAWACTGPVKQARVIPPPPTPDPQPKAAPVHHGTSMHFAANPLPRILCPLGVESGVPERVACALINRPRGPARWGLHALFVCARRTREMSPPMTCLGSTRQQCHQGQEQTFSDSGGGKISGGDNFEGKFRLSGTRRNFPLAKFRGVGSAVKMPTALRTLGP